MAGEHLNPSPSPSLYSITMSFFSPGEEPALRQVPSSPEEAAGKGTGQAKLFFACLGLGVRNGWWLVDGRTPSCLHWGHALVTIGLQGLAGWGHLRGGGARGCSGGAGRGQTRCSLRLLQEEKPPGPLVFSGHEIKTALILNKIRRKKNELSGSKSPFFTTSLQL